MTDFAELAVGIDSSGVLRGERDLKSFTRQGADTEAKMTKSAAAIGKGWAKMATGVGIALSAVFSSGAVLRGIAQFETSMSKVAAISGATGRELDDLRKTAQRLGSTTEFSAGQAADALGFLSMAGFEASESIAAIPAVLDLATASGLDLARSADIASNVLSGFGKSAGEAANVADVLAEAASASNTSVGQLGSAMSTVAPISAALGVSMEETAAAIGTMSDAGIQGERAGTALRGVMSALAGPTDAAADALAQYGLSIADVNPETHSLAEIMATLAERGLTTADAMTIFGREAASGALVMAGASDSMAELTERFENADGAASDMAATMRDNLGGDLNGMKSAAEGLILALGEAGLTAVIRGVVQIITEFVRGVTALVDIFGRARKAVTGFLSDLVTIETAPQSLARGMAMAELAIDNSTIAMGDQIRQSALLEARLRGGNIMTVESARVNLESAKARLADVDSMMRQNEESARNALGVVENFTAITNAQDALAAARNRLTGAEIEGMAAYGEAYSSDQVSLVRDLEAGLSNLLNEQKAINAQLDAMNFLTPEQAAAQARSQSNIEKIEAALAKAKGGMVSLNGEVVGGITLSSKLSSTIDGITFANAISGAAFLANDIGVNIGLAEKLNATLNQTAGIQSAAKKSKFSYGLDSVGIPNDVSNANLGFGNLLSNTSKIRFDVPDLSGGGVSGLSGGGGSSGGGGGGSSVEQGMSALDRLLNGVTDQTPTEKVEAWHSEVMTALNDANLIERGMLQEHADYKLNIEKLYQQQLAEIQANEHSARLQELGGFFGSMAAIAETGGEKMAKIAAAFSGAQTMIAAYEAAMKAAAEAKTIGGRLAAYAMFVAKGVATVQAIKKAGDNPRSVTGGGVSSGGEATSAPTQPLQVTMTGIEANSWYLGSTIHDALDMLNEAAGDNGMTIMRTA